MAPEPSRGGGLAAAIMVVVALGAGVSLTEFFVAPGYRPAAMRLVGALVLLLAVSRARAIVRACVERRSAWVADPTSQGWPDPAEDSRLARFRDEIKFSARSQSYFEHLLWPRLVALARARGVSAETLEKPPGRRLGRGPSLAALDRLIASLETRR